MSLDYGNLLGRAWQITWKHKVLWFFGVLASLGTGGNPGNPGSNSDFRYSSPAPGEPPQLPPQLQSFFNRFDQNFLVALGIGLACLALIVVVVLIALQVIGRGGLIGGVQLVEAQGNVTFGEAWSLGLSKFWTLFLIGLLMGIATFGLLLVILIPGVLLTIATFGIGLLCLLPLICVFAVVAAILSVIAYFAQMAAVLENLGVTDALRRGWEVIRNNLGPIFVLGLILIVVKFVVGLILALPILLILAPIFLGIIGFANNSQTLGLGSMAFALVCCALYLPVLLVLGGLVETWVTSAWTLAYQRLTQTGPSGPALAPSAPMTPAL